MIYSIFNDIGIACREKTTDELLEYFHSIGLYIFDDIYTAIESTEGGDRRKFPGDSPKSIILYIVYAYSEDSPMLIIGGNSKKEKEAICNYLNISEIWRHMLMTLECDIIRKAVVDYVERFAGIEFKTWQFMKIQYDDIMSMIINKQFFIYAKEEDVKPEFDRKGYFEAESKVERLGERITKLEKQMREKAGSTLKLILELQAEAKKDNKKIAAKKSLSIENSIHV